MIKTRKNRLRATAPESGFAIMMVMFLTTLLFLGAIAAAPYVRTERQREKEEVMIWRGKQYVRAIKVYYRKTGHFPTTVDDLTKPKLGSLRFLRQAYKDPMNKEDGSWRFIYVGPAGQLIGSLKPPQTVQMPGMPGAPATGVNPQQNNTLGASGFGQSPQTQGQPGTQPQPGTTPSGSQNGTNSAQPGTATPTPGASDADAANATPSGLLSSDSSFMGGNII